MRFDKKLTGHFDWTILWLVLAVSVIGLFNLYSATFNLPSNKYFVTQLYWFILGFIAVFVAVVVDYRFFERITYPLYILFVLLLAFVLIKGRFISGSRRWIELGFFSLQPSELAKLAVIMTVAKFFQNREKLSLLNLGELILPMLIVFIPVVLILMEPDLGTSLLVALICGSMIMIIGIKKRTLIVIIVAIAIMVPFAWMFVIKDYQKSRVYAFLNPEKDPLGAGYQVIQSKIAVGSGMLIGKGYLNGTQSKLQFLPKQHTDFIMSNYSEEWGFFGSAILLLLLGGLVIKGLSVAYNAKERFGALLAFGLSAFFFWQIFINVGMELGMLPVVGMTLPLFSYGGSSLITNLIAAGLLMNISMRRYMF